MFSIYMPSNTQKPAPNLSISWHPSQCTTRCMSVGVEANPLRAGDENAALHDTQPYLCCCRRVDGWPTVRDVQLPEHCFGRYWQVQPTLHFPPFSPVIVSSLFQMMRVITAPMMNSAMFHRTHQGCRLQQLVHVYKLGLSKRQGAVLVHPLMPRSNRQVLRTCPRHESQK
jgi:hypothetical protein